MGLSIKGERVEMKTTAIPRGYCDFGSAANYIGMSRKTMKKGIKSGEIEAFLLNNVYYVSAKSVLHFIEAHRLKTDYGRRMEEEKKERKILPISRYTVNRQRSGGV